MAGRQALVKTGNKAVLLSAFGYPGAGQLYLKRYALGIALIVIATIALLVAMVPLIQTTQQLVLRIESGELSLGPELFTELHAAVSAVTGPASGPGMVLLASWLFGIVHAWRAGRSVAS